MLKTSTFLVAVALAVGAFGQAGTGFSIYGYNGFFVIPDVPTSGTVGKGLTSDMGSYYQDQMVEYWWWYRVSGVNAREYAFNNAKQTIIDGYEVATTQFRGLDGFDADISYYTYAHGANWLRVDNQTSEAMTVDAFLFMDINAFGGGDDVFLGESKGVYEFNDAAPGHLPLQLAVTDLIGHAGVVGRPDEILTILTDGDSDDFATSGISYQGPGDLALGVQWTFNLDPGFWWQEGLTFNVVPEPSTVSAVFVGLLGLVAKRRRS